MIRFDEAPITRRFKFVKDSTENIKVTKDTFYDIAENELFCIEGSSLYSKDEMVSLIDKCANCRYFDTSGECMMGVVDQGNGGNIIIDTENFWCSEGIIKGD